jgi:hypothetical protein
LSAWAIASMSLNGTWVNSRINSTMIIDKVGRLINEGLQG